MRKILHEDICGLAETLACELSKRLDASEDPAELQEALDALQAWETLKTVVRYSPETPCTAKTVHAPVELNARAH